MKTRIIALALFSMLMIQAQAQRYPSPYCQHSHPDYFYLRPMHPADFDHLYTMISHQSTDSRKMQTAIHAIENNLMKAEQISYLVSLMTSERNKVDLAKAGWLNVHDPGSYFKVLNMLTFNASVREMHEFMAANPRPAYTRYSQPRYFTYPVAMHPEHFREAKATVASQAFEDSKLHVAKQVAVSNRLTSQQVYELMTLFTFEDTRLSFAIFAFQHVNDPGNYFLTHRAFKFSSSVEQLSAAIFRGNF